MNSKLKLGWFFSPQKKKKSGKKLEFLDLSHLAFPPIIRTSKISEFIGGKKSQVARTASTFCKRSVWAVNLFIYLSFLWGKQSKFINFIKFICQLSLIFFHTNTLLFNITSNIQHFLWLSETKFN